MLGIIEGNNITGLRVKDALDSKLGFDIADTIRNLTDYPSLSSASTEVISHELTKKSAKKGLNFSDSGADISLAPIPNGRGSSPTIRK